MIEFWPEYSYGLYKNAVETHNYPEVPFGKYIKKYIKPEYSVLDIGCGFGFVSVYLSKLCKSVVAIDQDSFALAKLEENIVKNDFSNIDTICGVYPDVELPVCDASIAFYVAPVSKSVEGIIALLKATKRCGIITSLAPNPQSNYYDKLRAYLGLPPKNSGCQNACRTAGNLEMAGCKVVCERITHEFGQPVADMDEAVRFMCWQVGGGDEYLPEIRKIAKKYTTIKDGGIYIPIYRDICVICFEK